MGATTPGRVALQRGRVVGYNGDEEEQMTQLTAVFVATYFIIHPLHAWMMPNVPAAHRNGKFWSSLKAWGNHRWRARAFLASVAVLCFTLWTWGT